MQNKNILFLCTHNSCRSQMAEGFAKQIAPDEISVASAGTEAKDIVCIMVLDRHGCTYMLHMER